MSAAHRLLPIALLLPVACCLLPLSLPVCAEADSHVPRPDGHSRNGGGIVGLCDNCGNDYDKSFELTLAGRTYTFDSFECAIHLLAPVCGHCGCRIIGHGQEVDGRFFCCVHCAETDGVAGLKDRL